MKRTNTRVRHNSGTKTTSNQPSAIPDPAAGNGQGITIPAGLTMARLVQLKVLSGNLSKFGLSAAAIRALAECCFRFELKPEHEKDLPALLQSGWVTNAGADCWRITDSGRAVLQQFSKPAAAAVPAH